MSFLEAFNALAKGAQGGFNAKAILDRQQQDREEAEQAKQERALRLAEMIRAQKERGATNEVTAGLVNQERAQQGDGQARGLEFGSQALKNLPFAAGGIPDIATPAMGQMMDQSAGDIRKDAAPKPFNPDVNYGSVLNTMREGRKLENDETQTRATRQLAASNAEALTADRAARLAEAQRLHDADVAEAADIKAHAPAARSWLKSHGVDESSMNDGAAVQSAQRLQEEHFKAREKPEPQGPADLLRHNADGTDVWVNPRTHAVTGAMGANGEPLQTGFKAPPAPMLKAHGAAQSVLSQLDELLGPESGGMGSIDPKHPNTGTGFFVGHMPGWLQNKADPDGTDARAKLANIRTLFITSREGLRPNAQFLKMAQGLNLDESLDPQAILRQLHNIRTITKQTVQEQEESARAAGYRLGGSAPQAGAPQDDPFAKWKAGGH